MCKKFAMILIVLIVFTGCGQNRITEKEEKKETVESEMNAEAKKAAQNIQLSAPPCIRAAQPTATGR